MLSYDLVKNDQGQYVLNVMQGDRVYQVTGSDIGWWAIAHGLTLEELADRRMDMLQASMSCCWSHGETA